jgi:excisionase family DNA binding protein
LDIQLLRVAEVAKRLTISRSKTYELIAAGQLRALRVGRSRRIPASELERFVAERIADEDTAGRRMTSAIGPDGPERR